MDFSTATSRASHSFDTGELYLILSALKDARMRVLANAKVADDENALHWMADYQEIDHLIDRIRSIPWIVDHDDEYDEVF